MSTHDYVRESGTEMRDQRDERIFNGDADDDRTPRASIDRSQEHSNIANAQHSTATLQTISHQDADDRIAVASQDQHASDAASTLPPESNYAHSTILSTASLLSHDHEPGFRSTQHATTKGRKAFTIFCHVLDVMVPIDVDENVTNMGDSSIGRIGKAVQERGRRMAGRESVGKEGAKVM